MKCYKCGRSWRFDGSVQRDNRCFSCEPNGSYTHTTNTTPSSNNSKNEGMGGGFWILSIILLFVVPPVGVIMIFIAVINEP
jgi:hypothetical protein